MPRYHESMRVLVFEDNLMWSSRLVQSLRGLGHEAILRTKPEVTEGEADAAIVNLGSATLTPQQLIPLLRTARIHTIGHAGHKEKDILQLGKETGCETLVSNSELTFKLGDILKRIQDSSQ